MNAAQRIFVVSFFVLTACAPQQPDVEKVIQKQPSSEETSKRIALANQLSSWEISGAIAARNNNKGWTASLNWVQQGPSQYQMRLFGPLGNGAVLIDQKSGEITYHEGSKVFSSSNAEDLLKQQTGVRLPVNNLYYWVRGLPAPGSIQSAQRDENNRLLILRQAGYTIEYTQYTQVDNLVLPSHIKLQGHDVLIKLAIKKWKTN